MFDPKKKVEELVALPSETEIVEFKEANSDYDFRKIGKYFSALSNEANLKNADSAWLVFGIEDKTHAYTNSLYRTSEAHLQNLKAEIATKTTSGLTFLEIHAFEIEPGKRIVLFQIPPAPLGLPVAWNGHYYARNHEDLVPLNLEKLERIRLQVTRKDWSKGICVGATITDLSVEAIVRARELFKNKNTRLAEDVDKWDDLTFLNKARITIDSKITNTAILLLGKPESVHFLSPAVSKISWILKDKTGMELDYEHFTSPLLLSVDQFYQKIRNLRYRYIQEGSLFPEEVYKYEPYVIREALNNCIAHQDYNLAGKINVVEYEDSLVFSNRGSFLPVRIENVIKSDAPSEFYRNRFLSDAMVNLSMIDTIGSGIRKMFLSQKAKYFPLPEYDLSEKNRVTVTIIGKVLDLNYARKLAQIPDLSLDTIILLDKVQKKKDITALEARELRALGLIEGTRPNVYISSKVASKTNEKTDYMKRRGIDDKYCKKMIVDYLKEFGEGTRSDFESMLFDKLSANLTPSQKKHKIKNLLQSLKKEEKIALSKSSPRLWKLK